MASGSFSGVYKGFTLRTDWSSASNIAGNYSTITCNHYLVIGQYYSLYINGRTNYCTVNGETKSFGSPSISAGSATTIHLGTTSYTVNHNSDGKKSVSASTTFYIQATIAGTYVDNITASGTMALDNIPRYANITSFSVEKRDETSVKFNYSVDANCDWAWYSTNNGSSWANLPSNNIISGLSPNTTYNFKIRVRRTDSQLTTDSGTYAQTTYDYPYCSESPNFTIGNSTTMKVYNPLGRTVTITMVGANGSTKTTGSFSGTSLSGFSNVDWQNFWYSSIPNSKSGTYQVKVNYGSITKTRNNGNTYSVKGTETPTVGSITYADTNATVTAITGNNQHIVQNYSNLKVTYGVATAKNSASISKYTFVLNGVTKESTSAGGTIDFGKINSANNLTLTMTVTDSRGLTSSSTKTITMLEHSDPTAIVELKRLNNYEDESYLTVDGSVSSVNSKNTMAIKYRYKISGGSYGNYTTINDKVKQTLSLDKNNVYVFEVVVTDAFGSTFVDEYTLGKGVFPFFIDTQKNSLGMNMFPRAEKIFEIDGRIVESEKEFSVPITIGAKAGWYLAMSGNMPYVTNKAFLIAIQQTSSGGAGLLYFNMRYNNNTLSIQRFEWITYSGISSQNVKLKVEGNNFYLYLKTTANYQQYYLKVLQEKILDGWKFRQYTMHSPDLEDTVEEPEGISPDSFVDKIYPVGSIYMSVNSTNPSTLFGGTWEQLKDRFLLGAGNTYANGTTGGEATHTLTANEIPDLPVKFSNMDAQVLTKDGTILTNLTSGYSRGVGKWDSGTDGTLYADGGNQPHNNMPPYLAVYMWKRVS